MKICVLDGYSVNPGDLSWDELAKLGDLTVYDRSMPGEVAERAKDAEIVLVNKVVFRESDFRALPNLKLLVELATGYNNIDLEAAKKYSVAVANIPAYSTDSVAQMAFAHILNITHHVARYADEVREGKWTTCRDFCFWDAPLFELSGRVIGIIGLGHTGMATARIALAFGMKVLAKTSKPQSVLPKGIEAVSLDRLLAESDIVSLHCPLADDTRGIINRDAIAKMKKTAILINTGRGPLLVEDDVAEALNSGRIAAAGIDVLSKEPPREGNPLLSARNCYVTPHIAWATVEARTRLMAIAVENVRQFVAGEELTNRVG